MRRLLLLLAGLVVVSWQGTGRAREKISFPAAGVEVVDTSVGSNASGIAWVTRSADGDRLFVDGELAAHEKAIDQIHVTAGGEVVYWATDGERQVVVYRGEEGPAFEFIYIPDLELLAALATPGTTEWSFLGGTRVAFAARDRNDEWTALLRFPAAVQNQEKRPLPVTRGHLDGADPASRSHRPLRYRLLRDKVPIYIGQRGREECLVIGRKIEACGKQVALLAVAGDLGQAAFGIMTPDGLELHSRFGTVGPTSNVDWVSFSPDGQHLACVIREKQGQALYVDGVSRSLHELVSSALWLPDNRLLALVHGVAGSQVLVDGSTVLEKKLIERLLVSPQGEVFAIGKDDAGPFIDPLGQPGQFTSIWGEGFLTGGSLYGLLRLPDGKVSLLGGTRQSEPYSAVSRVSPAPDGKQLAAVGASVDGDAVILDGELWQAMSGRVARFAWCGGEKLQVLVRTGDQECLMAAGVGAECCPRFVATGCDATGRPTAVCLKESRYVASLNGAPVGEPFEDVPLHLVFQEAVTGGLEFAGRVGDVWTLFFNGQAQSAAGKPLQVHPGIGGAWFLVQGSAGYRWVGGTSATEWFDAISAPLELRGHTLFKARRNGREAWVDGQRTYGWHDAILSTLYLVDGGGFYWARDEGLIHLDSLEF